MSAVPRAYRAAGSGWGIDPKLLFAVALTESGRPAPWSGLILPWPWTMNIQGRAMFYPSRAKAELDFGRALGRGISPDVGLMQINWYWHNSKLTEATAFDPWRNLTAGARILRECRSRASGWWDAVGLYHSSRPARAARYCEKVKKAYNALL